MSRHSARSGSLARTVVGFCLVLPGLLFSVSSWAQKIEIVDLGLNSRFLSHSTIANRIETIAREKKAEVWMFTDINPGWSDELINAVALGADMEVGFYPQRPGRFNRWLLIYKLGGQVRPDDLSKPNDAVINHSSPDLGS